MLLRPCRPSVHHASPGAARVRGWPASPGHPMHPVVLCHSGRGGTLVDREVRPKSRCYVRSTIGPSTWFSPHFISLSPDFRFVLLQLLTQPPSHSPLPMGSDTLLTQTTSPSLQSELVSTLFTSLLTGRSDLLYPSGTPYGGL